MNNSQALLDWIDNTRISDRAGGEVSELSECLLAAHQAPHGLLPSGVKYTFNGASSPAPNYPDELMTEHLFDLACLGVLSRHHFLESLS
jgi:hypothetical protein